MIGPVQTRLIERALRSRLLLVMPADRNEARSLRGLERQGVMECPTGWPALYRMSMLGCEMMSGGKSG